jgi:hypothetical protein
MAVSKRPTSAYLGQLLSDFQDIKAPIILMINEKIIKMTKQTILLVGPTGETGRHILNALIDDDSFVGKSKPQQLY